MSQKRQEQRGQLLQAAYELVPEVGVKGLRTRDIAARASLHLSTFHYCFESKDAFLRGLYQFIMDQFEAERANYMAEGASPPERLERRLQATVHLIRERPMALRALRAFFSEAWVDETVREIVRQHYAQQRARIAGWIAEGQEDGTLAALRGSAPEVLASLFLSCSDGLVFQSMIDPEAFPVDDYARAVTMMFDCICEDSFHGGCRLA